MVPSARILATCLVLSLSACGPQAVSYDVDMVLLSLCDTRAGEQTCQEALDENINCRLSIEPRGDALLLLLGERVFVATQQQGVYQAKRHWQRADLDNDCEQRSEEIIQVQTQATRMTGTFNTNTLNSGDNTRCGQTPFGESRSYALEGVEVSEL